MPPKVKPPVGVPVGDRVRSKAKPNQCPQDNLWYSNAGMANLQARHKWHDPIGRAVAAANAEAKRIRDYQTSEAIRERKAVEVPEVHDGAVPGPGINIGSGRKIKGFGRTDISTMEHRITTMIKRNPWENPTLAVQTVKGSGRRSNKQRGGNYDFYDLMWDQYKHLHPEWSNEQLDAAIHAGGDGGGSGNFFSKLISGAKIGANVFVDTILKPVAQVVMDPTKITDPKFLLETGKSSYDRGIKISKEGKGKKHQKPRKQAGGRINPDDIILDAYLDPKTGQIRHGSRKYDDEKIGGDPRVRALAASYSQKFTPFDNDLQKGGIIAPEHRNPFTGKMEFSKTNPLIVY